MIAVALAANPESGGGNDPEELERRLVAHGARVVPFEEAERLVVAGGDGSVAPAALKAGEAGIPLALVPTGTANDFARATGVPADLAEACRLAVHGDHVRAMELGRMDGRPFVNACNAGLAVSAARSAAPFKRALGPLAYALGAVRAGVSAQPVECTVACDGEELFSGKAWQVIVAVTGHFGGGSEIGVADPCDGRLDVAVIEAGPRVHLVARAYGLRAGHVTRQEGVHHARCREARVEGAAGFNLDGEITEETETSTFSVEAGAFALVTDAHGRPGD